jgi:predicted Zn-dependent protease
VPLAALELAERALALTSGDGQVAVTRERSLMTRFARSAPTQATEVDDVTVEFAVIRDGHIGTASTNRTDEDGLRAAADRATAAARALAAHGPGTYPGLPAPEVPRPHRVADPATARLDPWPAGAAMADAFAVCAEAGLEAFGTWTAGSVRTAIASTAGVRMSDHVTDGFMKVMARDAHGRTGLATQATVASGELDGAALARRAVAKVGDGSEPAELGPGAYPVVLAPEAVGLLLEFLGALAFDGQAHVEGRGALSDRLGTTVASPLVSLSDLPRDPRTYPRAFDAEGTAKAALALVQRGVAHRVCHDIRSAALAGNGTRSTGHAVAVGGAGGEIGPVPTNLVLAGGGAADEEALCAPIERGIYVTRLWYVNVVHPSQTLLTGMTRDGTFLIEDGRITRPLRDVRFTDSVLRLLGATEDLTRDARLVTEAEYYGRRFANGVVAPALRAGDFRVTGGAH